MHHASSIGLLSAIRSGLGIAVLPCIVGDADPDLVRCCRREKVTAGCVAAHPRARPPTPRVRAVIDFLYERLSAWSGKAQARTDQPLGDRASAPVRHRPLADRNFDCGCSQQPR